MIKNFNIEVISKKAETIYRRKYYRGRITVGDFTETFIMSYDNWSIDEYKQQWKEGIERIKTHDSSCLVVCFEGTLKSPRIVLWTLYKEESVIYIHNQYLFYEIFQERSKGLPPFDANSCYLYIILPRETTTEDGDKISEWSVDLQDILEFRVI